MACQKCKSERVFSVGAKCSDMFNASVPRGPDSSPETFYEHEGFCGDCGQIQGEFPLDRTQMEMEEG